jgi:transcriptional regulator with XRE-family HTH domain
MNEKIYLPGTIGERVRDLRTARGITIKELSEKAGLDYSTISRIENGKIQKVADDIVLKLARFFNVSTDFLLGLTNIPDKKNYTAEELGLSTDAVKNLYTGLVDNQVADLLLSNRDFAALTMALADYFDEKNAIIIAVQNQNHQNMAGFCRIIGKTHKDRRQRAYVEAKKELAQRQPLYKTELASLETQFSQIIQTIKKGLPSHIEEKKKLTKDVFDQMLQELTKGENAADILSVTPEEIVDAILHALDGLDYVTEEDKALLRKAFLSLFPVRGMPDG